MKIPLIALSIIFLEISNGRAAPQATPRVIEVAIPGYPRLLDGSRTEGEVEVDVQIDKDGQVVAADAVVGPTQLKPWAEAAARQWLFETSEEGSRTARLVFTFVLQRGLTDPPAIVGKFEPPNHVEIIAEKRDRVILADPPARPDRGKRKPPSKPPVELTGTNRGLGQ